jgi:hypothetical protein
MGTKEIEGRRCMKMSGSWEEKFRRRNNKVKYRLKRGKEIDKCEN